MPQRAPAPNSPPGKPEVLTPAHLPIVIIGIAVLVALILGVGTGAINQQTFTQPVTQPGAPITVP